jgi:hypothetical protein
MQFMRLYVSADEASTSVVVTRGMKHALVWLSREECMRVVKHTLLIVANAMLLIVANASHVWTCPPMKPRCDRDPAAQMHSNTTSLK